MPQVTIRTGTKSPEGFEERLTEYLCDHPDCPNVATHLLGVLVELRIMVMVCDEHVPQKYIT